MKPVFKLLVGSKPLNIKSNQLVSLSITDNKSFDSDQFSLTLSDANEQLVIPQKGAKISGWIGWEVNQKPLLTYKGTFIVDDIGYDINPREITINGNSANFRAGLAKVETKSYHKKTFGEIAARIAKKHGLSLKIPAAIDSIYLEHIDQNNESDGHFLTRLAQHHDAMLNIKNDTLVILHQGKGQTASGNSLAPLNIDVSECESASYKETDRDSQYTGVKAKWHNTETGKTIWEVAGKPDKAQRLKRRYATQNEAMRAANTEWQKIQRGKKTLTLNLAQGKPNWITETPVTVSGVKKQIDQVQWITTKVTHEMGNDGYTCSGELEQEGRF